MVTGQMNVVRYYPYFSRALEVVKKLVADSGACNVHDQVCVCVCVCVCVFACVRLHMYVYMCVCACVYVRMCMLVYLCM